MVFLVLFSFFSNFSVLPFDEIKMSIYRTTFGGKERKLLDTRDGALGQCKSV